VSDETFYEMLDESDVRRDILKDEVSLVSDGFTRSSIITTAYISFAM
jgi:hypothetical protein